MKPIALIALLFLVGCASAPLDHDVIPAGYEVVIGQAQQDAVNWYTRKYHEAPRKVPHLRYISEPTPRQGGMWSTGNRVYFWVGQPDKRGSFCHEIKHHLNWANGRGATAGTQADEEAVR